MAPYHFNRLANALAWIMQAHTPNLHNMHYLDDYWTSDSSKQQCAIHLQSLLNTCHELAVSVTQEKIEGPAHVLTFLGIEFDSIEQVL